MTGKSGLQLGNQKGYTLVEVVVSSAIGLVLMTGLTSVLLTSVRATNVASARVEASSQIRSFQFFAQDDFARSRLPRADGCIGSPPTTCTINLSSQRASNSLTPTVTDYPVTYSWNADTGFLDRVVNGNALHAATNVTAFSYYLEGAPFQTVVVKITITIRHGSPTDYYSQSQIMRFYPRVQP